MKRYQTIGLAALLLSGMVCVPDSRGEGPFPAGIRRRTDTGFRRDGDFDGRRRRCNNNNQGVTVIYPDNGYGNWNNSNYLGYPPWYRMNYYTPWMSDYENGTAWRNIPNSHAGAPFGLGPDSVTDRANAYAAAQAAAAQAAATGVADGNVDYVVGVQKELRRRGYYHGVVNGVSDAPTRAAIRAFESANSLPVTGIIGTPLLRTLGFL